MDVLTTLLLFSVVLQATWHPVLAEQWKADVVHKINALASSCVVIPCTFTYPGVEKSTSRLRGIWHKNWAEYVYHSDYTHVLDSYKSRTKLLGHLGSKNCTLEIDEFKDHDADSYCFRIEIPGLDNFSFRGSCAQVFVRHEPEEMTISMHDKAYEGEPYTITCTATHTCPSHMPTLTWNREGKAIIHYTNHGQGKWGVQSTLTFIPNENDHDTTIVCNAAFHKDIKRSKEIQFHVKLKKNNMHIIIPVVATVATAFVFGGLCFLMRRKYKNHISQLQMESNSTSLWSRISRLSRRRSPGYLGNEPSGPEGRTFWGRFSRRGNPNVNYNANNATVACGDNRVAKPRFPSPKSNHKTDFIKSSGKGFDEPDDDYVNSEDLNIYGNM